ncbi:hypothetical protein MED121_14359 [Marinomonas sp. MED121]|uniref:hypothetical protein n=1 Tax=Marinomonas sp. MED121 TaxID=314277 RepID=UPI0000691060|nr:hypothetical protein [Marinomonas sp. MED121]EAQ67117.1 hypothetical protein MED121_14359 [Marinomonas sp. MED121]
MSKSKALHKQIGRYIQGKDGNKPYLLEKVFSQDAVLKMLVQSDAISFPAEVVGADEIINTLSSEFNLAYENIYTLCFLDTVTQSNTLINCRWLVGMTSKDSAEVRVGYGDYHWTFELDDSIQAKKLTIVIEDMLVLDKEYRSQILPWLASCTYPWAISSDVLSKMPDIDVLSEVAKRLAKII